MKKLSIILLCILTSQTAFSDDGDDVPSFCTYGGMVCVENGGTRYVNGVPVSEPCWKYERSYHCIDWGHETNSCSNLENCTATDDPVDYSDDTKKQHYKCTNTTTENICTKWDVKNVCTGADFIHGTDDYSIEPTDNFAQMASTMNMVASMTQSNVDIKNMQFYAGQATNCHTPRPATPVDPDCCDQSINTDGGKIALDKCDSDELALALSRRNKASHYVGDDCKKWLTVMGKHVRCLVYLSGYCRFTDELTRIIQEQGRAQINALVANGEKSNHNTITKNYKWDQTSSQPKWNHTNINGVSIASYTYGKSTAENIPIYIDFKAPLMVSNNKTDTIAGVGVSYSCNAGICSGSLNDGDDVKTIFFDPTCKSKPKQEWSIGHNIISQGYCLAVGDKEPSDWLSSLTWTKGVPSNWQFLSQSSMKSALVNGNNTWQLAPRMNLSATGSCTANTCKYTFELNSKGNELKKSLTIDLNGKGTQPVISIGDVTITIAYPPTGQVLAACNKGESCGPLPSEDNITRAESVSDYNGWKIIKAVNRTSSSAINSNVSYSGTCQGDLCSWNITSLGVNGVNTVMRSPIQWQLFNAPFDMNTKKQTPRYAPDERAVVTSTGNRFIPYQYSNLSPPVDTILVKFALSGETKFKELNLPVTIDNSKPYIITNSPYVSITGGCDLGIGICKYNVASKVLVTAMSWGTAKNPKCAGFTLQQLQMLDFNKMDLGEYTRDLGNQTLTPEQEKAMENATKHGVQDFNNSFTNGTPQKVDVNGGSNKVITVSPERGQGPFDVTLKAITNYPTYIPFGQCGYPAGTNANAVNTINIDWGDGSKTVLAHNNISTYQVDGYMYKSSSSFCKYNMPMFAVKHRYNAIDKTTLENIKVTLVALDGEHDTTFQVENEHNQEDIPTSSHVGGGSSNNSVTKKKNTLPNNGEFDPSSIAGTGVMPHA